MFIMSNTRRRWCNLWSFIIILTIFTERLSLNPSLLVAIVSKAKERERGGAWIKIGKSSILFTNLTIFLFFKNKNYSHLLHSYNSKIDSDGGKEELLRNQYLFADKCIIFEKKNECLQNKNWRVSVMFFPCRFSDISYVTLRFTKNEYSLI